METVSMAAERAAVRASRPILRNKALRTFIYHLAVAGLGYVMLYPILWLFASSFKGRAEIWTNVSSLIPQQFTLENYINGWRGFGGITFATFYLNSFFYAGVGTLLAVAASAVVAYGFARINFTGRRFWFACMLSTLMLPVQVQIIPQYIVFSQLGWINTFYPLLLPRIGGQAFFIFMIMSPSVRSKTMLALQSGQKVTATGRPPTVSLTISCQMRIARG